MDSTVLYANNRLSALNGTANSKLICRSSSLTVGGRGVRFEVTDRTTRHSAFAVRSTVGEASFVNQCAHLALELDWSAGEFFTADSRHLVCATHGALYNPMTGSCVGGACRGRPLQALRIIESNGCIYLEDEIYRLVGSE